MRFTAPQKRDQAQRHPVNGSKVVVAPTHPAPPAKPKVVVVEKPVAPPAVVNIKSEVIPAAELVAEAIRQLKLSTPPRDYRFEIERDAYGRASVIHAKAIT